MLYLALWHHSSFETKPFTIVFVLFFFFIRLVADTSLHKWQFFLSEQGGHFCGFTTPSNRKKPQWCKLRLADNNSWALGGLSVRWRGSSVIFSQQRNWVNYRTNHETPKSFLFFLGSNIPQLWNSYFFFDGNCRSVIWYVAFQNTTALLIALLIAFQKLCKWQSLKLKFALGPTLKTWVLFSLTYLFVFPGGLFGALFNAINHHLSLFRLK